MKKGDKYIQKYYRRYPVVIEWVSKKEVCFKDKHLSKLFVMDKNYFERAFEKYVDKN